MQIFIHKENFLSGISCDILKIISDGEGLKIYIKNHYNGDVIIAYFKTYISFLETDEGDRLVLIDELSSKQVGGFRVFIVKNSKFSKWLASQKYDVYDFEKNSIHYLILSNNYIVDVITFDKIELSRPIVQESVK